MFDIGWSELLLIGVIILFAFGPEDIPKIMYNLGRVMRRFRYMRYALSGQFEDFMEKAETQAKIKKTQEIAVSEVADDEGDADAHLIDMLPLPAHEGETKTVIVESHDPNAGPTDRG